MKSHIYRLNLCIHSINIHVSFPCTVGASFQIDNQQIEITDNVDIKQAQNSINATIETQVSLLFNPRTSVYSMKKGIINFFLKTKSGKLQAGSTTLFLNKSFDGFTKQVTPISKCSDREAAVQYSMHMELIEEAETNLTISMMKTSQLSDQQNSNLRTSGFSYSKKILQNSHLYESIVQQVDQNADQAWEKGSNGSKGSSGNRSFISDLKHIQSSKAINGGWRAQNESFRKSRLQSSVELQQQHRKTQSSYINNSVYQNKLSSSKVNFQQFQEDPKIVFQKKIEQLQKQNKQLKDTLGKIRQKYEQQIFVQKNSLKKSQIVQFSLKQELDLMRQKFGNLQQQSSKMMFQKNQILNKYNHRQMQNITQIKAKQKLLSAQNKRLVQKSQKLQKSLSEIQQKYSALEVKFKEQEGIWVKKQKQFQYYQQEAMELDQKLSQLRIVEEQLNNEIEGLKDQMSKKQQQYQKELNKFKKQVNETKVGKQQETKGLGKQLQNFKNSIKDKQGQIFTIKKQLQSQKKKWSQEMNSLQQQKIKLAKQLQNVQKKYEIQQKNTEKLNQIIQIQEQKIKAIQMDMQMTVQNKDEHLNQMQYRMQQLNLQQFRLNEHNFQLEQKLALTQNNLQQISNQRQTIQKQLFQVKQNLLDKQFKLSKLSQQLQQIKQGDESKNNLSKQLKKQLNKKQQKIRQYQNRISELQKQYNSLQKQTYDLEGGLQLKIKDKQDQVIFLNQKINQLQSILQDKQKQIDQMSENMHQLNQQSEIVKNQNRKLIQNIDKLQHQLVQNSNCINLLKQQSNNYKNQIDQIKSKVSKEKKITEQNQIYLNNIHDCIQVFQQCFSQILNKDYSSLIMNLKKSLPYKYSTANKNLPSSIKRNSVQKTDLKKLNAFSTRKNIDFAENLSTKLEQLEQFLTKMNEKQIQSKDDVNALNQQKQVFQQQLEKKNQQITSLHSDLQQLQNQNQTLHQQIVEFLKTQQKTAKQLSSLNNRLKDQQLRNQKQKTITQDLRQQLTQKNKQAFSQKNIITKNQQYLKQTQNAYKQIKDKMQIQVNLQINQLKQQVIQLDKIVCIQKQQNKRKQTKISQLQQLIEAIKSQNLKNLNQSKKQLIEIKRQLTQTKKDMERKNNESIKHTQIVAELNKKIQTISATNRQNLEKFQRVNQQNLGKNKQISESQAIIRDRVSEISRLKARINELELQSAKNKKQKEDLSKSLVAQQDSNSKNLLTIKELKEIISKKQQIFKQTQKQLKLAQGQLSLNQKKYKTQVPNDQTENSSVSNSSYSYKKLDPKKQDNFSPNISAFTYKKSYLNSSVKQPQQSKEQQTNAQIKGLKQKIHQKQKMILEMQQKLNSKATMPKQKAFLKLSSLVVQTPTSNSEQRMKQQILQNLESIQNVLLSSQSGIRFDKYKIELVSLINKNKKIIMEATPFEQMRQLNMAFQKLKSSIQNKYKIQPDIKTLIFEDFKKIQSIIDQVMGK